jgi:hypothetical protein
MAAEHDGQKEKFCGYICGYPHSSNGEFKDEVQL